MKAKEIFVWALWALLALTVLGVLIVEVAIDYMPSDLAPILGIVALFVFFFLYLIWVRWWRDKIFLQIAQEHSWEFFDRKSKLRIPSMAKLNQILESSFPIYLMRAIVKRTRRSQIYLFDCVYEKPLGWFFSDRKKRKDIEITAILIVDKGESHDAATMSSLLPGKYLVHRDGASTWYCRKSTASKKMIKNMVKVLDALA